MKTIMTCFAFALVLISGTTYGADLSKCKNQAAKLAHIADENSKPHANYEIFDHVEISRTDPRILTFTMHWDIESYDSSSFTVEMFDSSPGACEVEKMIRN